MLKSVPKWTKIGVVGVVMMYIALAGTLSAALPWWIGKGDSALHLDYALSIYHGEIPHYHDYVQYPIFHQLDPHYIHQAQRAVANPPLFYILHAPIVGPWFDSGHWKTAIGLGRSFNIFLGALAVLALAWAGWVYGGRRRALMAVATPAVGGLMFAFTSLNQNYAVDVLLVLLGVLTAIVWPKLLDRGLEPRLVASTAVLSILGMATKATYIVFLLLSLLAILLAALLHGQGNLIKRLWPGALICGAIMAGVAITSGWFYVFWNYKTSGHLFDASLPGDFGSRPVRTLPMVLKSNGLWRNFYNQLTSSQPLSVLVTITSLVGITYTAIKAKASKLTQKSLLTLGLLALLLIGTTMTQIAHATGIGRFGFRYFLPAILVYSLFVAYGLLAFKFARGLLLAAAAGAMVVTSLITTARLDNIKAWVPAVDSTTNIFTKLQLAMHYNGFSTFPLVAMLILLVVGWLQLVAALFLLSKSSRSKI